MKDQNKLPDASSISRDPLPRSTKVYVHGKIHPLRVAMREIETDDEVEVRNGSIKKEKVRITVYDTSGPYTDPSVEIDVHRGLKPMRNEWIRQRQDVEQLSHFSSAYTLQREADEKLNGIYFKNMKKPLRAKRGMNVTQMHYARKGMVTPEM